MSVHTSWTESREQRAEIVAGDKVQINNIGVRTQAVSGLREGQLSNKTWTQGSGPGYRLGQTPHKRSNLAKIFGLVQHTGCLKKDT